MKKQNKEQKIIGLPFIVIKSATSYLCSLGKTKKAINRQND